MSATTAFTADELLTMSTGMGKRYELVGGELRVLSAFGWRHGMVASRLASRLGTHVAQQDLGVVFGTGTGFRIASDPDTVRAPDVSFVTKRNIPKQEPKDGFWPGAPDLAIEVLSPGDRTGEVDEKIDAWLAAGCAAVWIINPKLKTGTVYLSRADVQVKAIGDVLHGDPVVPGFACSVDELFR